MSRARTRGQGLPAGVWCDANAEFAHVSGYRDFAHDGVQGLPDTFPVILELGEGHDVEEVRGLWRTIAIPGAYPDGTRFATARLRADDYAALRNTAWGGIVARWALQMPVVALRPSISLGGLPGAAPVPSTQYPAAPRAAADGAGRRPTRTVVAVIDSGCPFADPRYLRQVDGKWQTRILALWDQTDGALAGIPAATTPADFGRGAELRAADIEAWLDACRGADGAVDEQRCYLRAGYPMMGEGFTHGAAVLDLAAGPLPLAARYPVDAGDAQRPPCWDRAEPDEAARSDIVFVQVAREAVEDSTSASLPLQVLDALRYIVARAAGARHVVVNLSDGTSRALHDGHSLLEAAIRDLLDEVNGRGDGAEPMTLELVVAAGNGYAQARHAVIEPLRRPSPAGANGRDVAVLRLPVDNEQAAFLHVEVPPGPGRPRLRITPPAALGCRPFTVAPGRIVTWYLDGRPCLCVVMPWAGTVPTLALAAWPPTVACPDGRHSAPAGHWGVQCLGAEPATWRLWVSLAQNNMQGPASIRQARFIDVDGTFEPERWMRSVPIDPEAPRSAIRRTRTLSVPATMAGSGRGVVAVGARLMRATALPSSRYFSADEGTRSAYSSIGATLDDPPQGLPADFAHAQPGIRGAGCPSGRVVAVMGTSFSAPQVARLRANAVPRPARRSRGHP